jgi:hypothetical protein
VWLKLERRGTLLTAFRSADGAIWTALGTQSISMGATVHVGMAVSSLVPSTRATATFSNVAVQQTTTGITVPNQPPTVSLTPPANTFTAPATIPLAATASDSDGSVAQVDFYAGNTLLGSDTSAPYTYSWTGVPAGSYSLSAVARDNAGLTTTSAAVALTVMAAANQPPAVSLSSPAAGATFAAPASITIAANASDADGSVQRVDFYAGTTLIGSDSFSPYSVTWQNVPPGSYSILAVARDNANGTTVSSERTVTVSEPQLPTHIVFAPSTNHGTAVTSYFMEIFAAGTNPAVSNAMAMQDLGKPDVVNGQAKADVRQTIAGLPPGSYIARVSAIGPGGTAPSAASSPFVR